MKTIWKKIIVWSSSILGSSEITEDELVANFAAMGDIQFSRIKSSELTPTAYRLWKAERDRRQSAGIPQVK